MTQQVERQIRKGQANEREIQCIIVKN